MFGDTNCNDGRCQPSSGHRAWRETVLHRRLALPGRGPARSDPETPFMSVRGGGWAPGRGGTRNLGDSTRWRSKEAYRAATQLRPAHGNRAARVRAAGTCARGRGRCGRGGRIITFTVILVPRIHTVLESVAHQRVVDAHVTVAEEGVAFAGS